MLLSTRGTITGGVRGVFDAIRAIKCKFKKSLFILIIDAIYHPQSDFYPFLNYYLFVWFLFCILSELKNAVYKSLTMYEKTCAKRIAIFKQQRNLIKKLTKLNIIAYSHECDVGQIVFKTTHLKLQSIVFVLKIALIWLHFSWFPPETAQYCSYIILNMSC